ncbi:MAG TPA: hypothetical protein VFD58_18445 [Blastocatellia bacterium]|nr:hypothetical protein [Blastocatellia bacterium]
MTYLLLGAAFASVAFLTRSIGITLLAAGMLYLIKERLLRAALIFAAVAALCSGPWMLYSRTHAPTPEQRQEQQGYIVSNYADQFWQRMAGDSRAGQIRLSELPQRVWKNTAQIASDNVGMLMAWPLAMVIGPGGLAVLSVLLSLVILLGYVSAVRERITAAEILVPLSLLLTVLWPWDTTRFIFPLTPLLVYYLIVGVGAIMRRLLRNSYTLSKEGPLGAMSVAAWVIAALAIIGNLQYISLMDHPRFKMVGEQGRQAEVEAMLQWVNEKLPNDGICASLNPALVYLYTGRKTISGQELIKDWEAWQRMDVRYLVLTSPYGVPERDSAGNKINILYQSKRDPSVRVFDLGSKVTRANWDPSATPR